MTVREAITRADALRPNTITEGQKAAWVSDLDAQFAEMLGVPAPENTWPVDRALLLQYPHEEVYQLYLICRIDYYNQDMALYGNDAAVYRNALAEAQAYWRRNNRQKRRLDWRVM